MFFHGFTSYSSFPDFTPNVSTLRSLLAQDFLKKKQKKSYLLYHIFFNVLHICYTAVIFVKHYLLY